MQTFNLQAPGTMPIRYCALGLGILFLLLGLAGFLPNLTSGPEVAFPGPGYGYVLGLFPTNYFHNAIGILVGLWGIAAFTSLGGSLAFNRAFTVIYAAQAILGLLPIARTFFGTMPLYGNNIWLSALTAAIAFYYGFVKPQQIMGQTGMNPGL